MPQKFDQIKTKSMKITPAQKTDKFKNWPKWVPDSQIERIELESAFSPPSIVSKSLKLPLPVCPQVEFLSSATTSSSLCEPEVTAMGSAQLS